MSKIYLVKDLQGEGSLVRAHTSAGALKFKRNQKHYEAKVATQDDLLELLPNTLVEDATAT
jgi:hypothetical protein